MSEERIERLIEMYGAGVSLEEISKELGWAVSTIYGKLGTLRKDGRVGKRPFKEKKKGTSSLHHFPYKEDLNMEQSVNVQGLSTCYMCGKQFCRSDDWIYKKKIRITGKTKEGKARKSYKVVALCGWNCMRAMEKQGITV